MFLSLRFRHPPHARQACARCALVMRGSNGGMRLRVLASAQSSLELMQQLIAAARARMRSRQQAGEHNLVNFAGLNCFLEAAKDVLLDVFCRLVEQVLAHIHLHACL